MKEDESYKFLENLADLKNGNAILEAVEGRYHNSKIYTFVGSTLLALNPNRQFDIYDYPIVEQYLKNGPFANETHIFSVVNQALRNVNNGSSQETILFSGSSGSGKTTNAFHTMQFLAAASNKKKVTCDHINALQVILDRIGSAKTLKNSSATRFGYSIDFLYQKKELQGLKITQLLPLELSRLVLQKKGEQSFAALYQLCAGLDFNQKEKYGIKSVRDYFYLNQGRIRSNTETDKQAFIAFESALKIIGFSENQRELIFKLLSVILHVGNLYFQNQITSDGIEIVEIANESELKWISHLLEIDLKDLKKVFLTTSQPSNKNDINDLESGKPSLTFQAVTTIDKALDIRDSFAKTLYNELFKWILNHISLFFQCSNSDATISVIDLFGFEKYNNNTFEEFCINSINEKLEKFFIQKNFKNFQTDYEDEGIACEYRMPSSLDNERVVNMIFNRPFGILPLLMDESRFPKGSDEAFFQRSNINHLDKSIYCKPRTKEKFEFGIRHFAGITYYNVEGFLANNRWTELSTIFDLLSTSENPSLAFLIPKSSNIRKNRTIYVADEYSKAVSQLYDRLNDENVHFIRCIRVNSDQTSTKFDSEVIGRQMKALSIQEIYRMSILGYSHKINIKTFIKNFRCLLPIEVLTHKEPEKIAEDILNAQGTKYFGDYAIGSHSVFLKDRLLKQLEDSKHALQDSSAIMIQRNIRKFLAEKRFERKKQSAVKIQSAFRGWNARKKTVVLKEEELRQVEEHVESPILQESANTANKIDDTFVGEKVAPSAPVQWYELPEEINTILNQEAINLPKVKTATNYLPLKLKADIPIVDALTIEEFAELNLKNHILEARREPILTPFLPKEDERDFKLSCDIFKLILRYMNDTTMTAGQRSVLAKYIIQQGIEIPSQRDEIFMQLCNQTYNNRNPENSKTAWNLILMAVNSFPPGILIFPMIKDYFERQPEPLSTHLLNGLFRSLRHNDTNRKRTFSSTTLEQQAYHRRQTPVVQIILPDGDSIDVEVDAWSTIEEIVERVLRLRGLIDSEGWGLTIDNGEINSVVHGQSFLFDAVSQFEIPSVPPEDSPFLNFRTISKSKSSHFKSRSTPEEETNMRNAHSVMESPSPKPNNGILKSSSRQRLTPEEYANMSVASRIRNMKIPGNNGDVNKFLDEVFDQALPANEENSTNLIAASIKGGAGPDPYYHNRPTEIYRRAPASPRYNGAVSDLSDRRHVPSGLSSSINLSADDGRDSRFSGSLPPSRQQIFSPSRSNNMYLPETPSPPPTDERISRTLMNDDRISKENQEDIYLSRPSTTMQIRTNDRARTPTNMTENSRLGQIQPTSQHARYVGNGNNNNNGVTTNNRQNGQPSFGRRRFESPAAERRARALNSRSKSTPRGFTNGDYPAPILPPPDYDQNDTYTIKRAPRQFSNGNNNYPRSVSSTPRATRNGYVRAEESPRFARQQSYELGSPHYMTGDSRRSPSKQANSTHFLENIDLQPRSPIYSYRNDTINRSRASAEPTYFENRTLSRNGANTTLPRKTPDSIVSNGHHLGETNGIYSRDMNKSYHEPSISGGPTKSAMSLISAKSQSSSNVPATCFISEPWKLIIRREVFFPGESLDDIDSIDLVFSQIISDCRKNKPHRIRHFERDRINSILNKYRVPVESLNKPNEVSIEVKQDIINEARKWPLYFSRMYPVIEERNNERVFMILGISENGIRLMTRNVENVNDPMVPQAHFDFVNIFDIHFEPPTTIKILTKQKGVTILTCNIARQAVEFMHRFLDATPKISQKTFVISIADYRINQSNHLSFHNGDIIQVIKIPNNENPPGAGNWLYGKIGNRFGWFPAEYVQPTSMENDYGSEIYAPPSAINNSMAFTTVPQTQPPMHYRNNSAIIYGSLNGLPENVYSNWEDQSMYGGGINNERLTMTEFAMKYFRPPKSSDFGSLTLNRKRKEWTWQELTEKVKYSNKPISHSLIRLENNEIDKLAVDMFASVMRYMGDLSLKRGQTMTDCVYEILSACHNNPALIDEIYCQVIKQTTTNKSSKGDSLLLGWRLFTILTAYFASSQTLQPYLIKYLNEIANDPRRPFNGTASLCVLNYQQTLKYGGRKFILTAAEVEAITSGKNVKRQAFELPGGQKRFISTKTITVAEEVIKELCTEMNVWSDAEQHEFALCYILEKDSTLRVLSNDEYILDITSELETRNEKFILILTRTVWIHPMREDNDLYIDVLFFQVVPNYMAGLLTIMPINNTNQLSAKTLDDAAALAALLFMASTNDPESFNEAVVQTIIPRTVLERANLSASNWFDRIKQKLAVFPKNYYGNIARLEFLKFVEKWPLYGSSFYFVNKCKFAEKTFKTPVVAVNKDGVKILASTTMETIWSCKLNDIRSSRKYTINGNGILDVNIVQEYDKKSPESKLIIDTDSGSEIARVIGQYVYLNNQKAQYIVNSRNSKQA